MEKATVIAPDQSVLEAFVGSTKTSAATLDSTIWGAEHSRSLDISERRLLLFGVDLALLLLIGYGLSWDNHGPGNLPGLAIAFAVPWLTFGQMAGIYDLATAARERACLRALMVTAGCFDLTLLVAFFLTSQSGHQFFLNHHTVVILAVLVPVVIGLWRIAYVHLFGAAHFRRRVLIVGAGAAARTLLTAIKRHEGHGVDPVAILDDDPAKIGTEILGVPVLGRTSVMWNLVADMNIEEVVLSVNEPSSHALYEGLGTCYEHNVAVSLMPKLYEEVTGQVPVEFMGPHWFGSVQLGRPGGRMTFAIKRLIDITVGAVGMIVALPLILGIALLVKLSSEGPVLHRQRRVGLHGKPFDIVKFRTMRADAEKPGQAVWAAKQDPRATGLGRWLRRTHLDELPQLFQVVRGEMSLVGPRPERPEFVRDLQTSIPLYRARYSMRPGIAGWAQLHYPYGASLEDALAKLRFDLYYVKNWTPVLDSVIMLRTMTRVLGFRGR